MALTRLDRVGDGSTTIYDVSFALGYLKKEYVYVYLEGAEYTTQLDYAWINSTQVELNSPVGVGAKFSIRRVVPRDVPVNDYEAGAILRESNLDDSFVQALMILEEIEDGYIVTSGDFLVVSDIDMQGHKVKNAADATDYKELVTLGQLLTVMSQNSITGSANGSTPKHSVNSLEGWTRALLGRAGVADTGLEDTPVESQRFDASVKVHGRLFETVADMVGADGLKVGQTITWEGYFDRLDGGGNSGVVKAGVHTHDGGHIFSLGATMFVEANFRGKSVEAIKFGLKSTDVDPLYDNSPALTRVADYVQMSRVHNLPSSPTTALKSAPEIVLPAGAFNMLSTVQLPRTCVVRGEDTILSSSIVGLVILTASTYAYRIKFVKITFDGYDAQAFTLNGQNLDNAKFQFDECVLVTRTETAGKYAIDILSQSAVVYLDKVDVINAPNFLKVKTDMTRINGGWVNGYGSGEIKPANSASISSDTQMRIYGTTFIPELDGSGTRPNVRWVDLYGKDIVCDSCNFGGENGGFDIVYSHVDARNNSFPYNAQGAVRIINSQVACRNAIVTLVGETATPSKYDFRNNTFTINRYGVSSQGLDFTKTIAETDALLAIRMIDQSNELYRRTVPEVTYSGVDKSPLYFPECLNSYVNRVHGVVGGSIRNLEAGGGNAVRILQVIKESASSGHFSGFVGKLRVINQNLDVQQIKQYTVYISWSPAAGVADIDIVQDSFNQNSAGEAGWFDRFAVTAANATQNSVDFLLTNTDTFAPWAFSYRLEGLTTQNDYTTGGFPVALTGATEQR